MIYAVDESMKNELINIYKKLSDDDKKEKPVIKKYEIKKIKTTEDKLKELFDNVEIK